MTYGEKMLWTAIFANEYTARLREFRVVMQSGDSYDKQKAEHRDYSACHAAETATLGLMAAQTLKTEDIGDDTQEAMDAVFECV